MFSLSLSLLLNFFFFLKKKPDLELEPYTSQSIGWLRVGCAFPEELIMTFEVDNCYIENLKCMIDA